MIHTLTGPHFNYVFEEDGNMFVRQACDCGCIDKRWQISEHDVIFSENKVLLFGNLKNLEIISNRAILGTREKSANMNFVRIYSPETYKNRSEQIVQRSS
jgi:hypothetical protein